MAAKIVNRYSVRNITLIALATVMAAISIQPAQAFDLNFGNGGGLRDENGKKCQSRKQVKRDYQAGNHTDVQVRDGDRKGTVVVYFTGTIGIYENIRWQAVYDLCKRAQLGLSPA